MTYHFKGPPVDAQVMPQYDLDGVWDNETRAGYGACSVKHCHCGGYKKSSSRSPGYCSGCGHHFSQHYS
jgi:hypothetical protein